MAVFLTSAETDNEVVLQWHVTQVGDIVDNPNGISSEHPTLLAQGEVRVQVSGQPTNVFTAPHIIILPITLPYSFTILTAPVTVYCMYNKCSGSADEIRQLADDVTIVR